VLAPLHTAVLRAWERLSDSGVRPEHDAEARRRLRIGNQCALIGVVTCLGFALACVVAGPQRFWLPAVANVAAAATLLLPLRLHARGRPRSAARLLLALSNFHLLVVAWMIGASGAASSRTTSGATP
jgi:hypothetical protein